jgi:hypothetical protein
MQTLPIIAAGSGLLVLGMPETILLLVILLVLFAHPFVSARADFQDHRSGLTRHDLYVLIFIGAVVAVGFGIVVWQRTAQ